MVEGDIDIEVVYAQTGQVWSRQLRVPTGTTAAAAVARSGLVDEHPEIRINDDCLGVFGRRVKSDGVLRDGDRVEVYRPLALDPMEARRRRARKTS